MNVQALFKEHLYWPDLDIDLHLDSIKNLKCICWFMSPINVSRCTRQDGQHQVIYKK